MVSKRSHIDVYFLEVHVPFVKMDKYQQAWENKIIQVRCLNGVNRKIYKKKFFFQMSPNVFEATKPYKI